MEKKVSSSKVSPAPKKKLESPANFSTGLKEEAKKNLAPVVVSPALSSPALSSPAPLAILEKEAKYLQALATSESSKKISRRYKVIANNLMEANKLQLKRTIGRFPVDLRKANKELDSLFSFIFQYYKIG